MGLSVFRKVCQNLFAISLPVLCGPEQNNRSLALIAQAIVIGFVVRGLGFCPLAVGNLSISATEHLAADSIASEAFPTTSSLGGGNARVLSGEFMASNAMGFRCGPTAGNVFLKRARFKVIWIYAFPIPAQVIQGQPIGNRAECQFVRESVGDVLLALKCQMAIARSVNGPDPKPTGSGSQNPLPERFIKRVRTHNQNQYAATSVRLEGVRGTSSTRVNKGENDVLEEAL